MKFNRLFGGASTAALAATARQVVSEEETPRAGAAAMPADEDDNGGPDDDNDIEDQEENNDPTKKKTGQGAAPAPAAAQPAPAAAAEAPALPANLAELNAFGDVRRAEGRTEVFGRMETVFNAREQGADGKEGELIVAGREAAAVELLAADLPADKVLATLAKLPKGASKDAMLTTLAGTPNPSLEPGGDQEAARADNFGWGKAHANVRRMNGRRTDK